MKQQPAVRSGEFSRQANRVMAGFSIVEALITLLILSVGLVSLAKFSASLTKEGGHAAARSEAVILGDQKLEEMRNFRDLTTYSSYKSGADVVGPSGSGSSIEMQNINQSYKRQWTVTDFGNYKSIDLQVSWPDSNGVYFTDENTVHMQSMIARLDPVTPALNPMISSGTTTTVAPTTTTVATTTTTMGSPTTTAATTTTTAATTTTTAATTTTTAATTTTTAATTTTTAATTTTTVSPTTTTTTTTFTPRAVTCLCKKGEPTGGSVGVFGCTSCCDVAPYSSGNSTHSCTIVDSSGNCTNP